jgi:oligopeptide transport system substrate-binding protein
MRGLLRASRVAALTASAALILTACGGGDDDTGEGGGGGEGAGGAGNADATFSVYIAEPENPLVPGNTTESEGNEVTNSLWTGLVEYNLETAELEYTGVAESIESEDNVTWTVNLKDGWTFHDGTPVTAQSFVDAWNYTSLSTNAFGGSSFFANVVGYDDLQAEEGAEPAAQEMSGLEVVDDQTFTVTLTEPFSLFPITTGYTAFYPLPQAFFDDPEGFGAQPIGNGPYQAESAFEPGTGITLTRYDDYAGENAAQNGGVEYKVYTEINTAYTDIQAGGLDLMVDLPPDVVTSAPDTFGERYQERPASDITLMWFPTYDERFADPQVRQAFSQAVDREAITEAIYAGTRVPATSLISPTVPGYREDACEFCVFDAAAAKAKLDQTDFDVSQPIELWFNAGAGHEEWVQAVGNQLRENLGVDYTLRGDLQFAEYLPLIDEQGMTGPFRLGWGMDYPHPQNFLEPLYSSAALPPAGSNAAFYSNEEVDALIVQGNSAENTEESVAIYQQAEDLILQDMPNMPMWYSIEQGVASERIESYAIDAFGRIDAPSVVVSE